MRNFSSPISIFLGICQYLQVHNFEKQAQSHNPVYGKFPYLIIQWEHRMSKKHICK